MTQDTSWINIQVSQRNPLGCSPLDPKNMQIKESTSSEGDQSSVSNHRSSKPYRAPDQDQPQHDPDPLFYREVALAYLPSQYAEEVETFRHILNLPDPRETMSRSSTSVLGLDDQKGQQKLRPRGPSSMLPLSSHIKDAFHKFEHDFWHLIYLKVNILNLLPPLQSGTRWDRVVTRTNLGTEYRLF